MRRAWAGQHHRRSYVRRSDAANGSQLDNKHGHCGELMDDDRQSQSVALFSVVVRNQSSASAPRMTQHADLSCDTTHLYDCTTTIPWSFLVEANSYNGNNNDNNTSPRRATTILLPPHDRILGLACC